MAHTISHTELILETINDNVILNRTLNFNPNTPTTYTNNFLAHIKLNTSYVKNRDSNATNFLVQYSRSN